MNIRQVLALVALFVTGLCVTGTAKAASCDQVVGDDAGLFGGDIGQVVVAANRLAAQGAFVRVRTTDNLGDGETTLGPATTNMVRNCLSWRSGTGARQDLLLLVLYRNPQTMKGKAELYAGGRFQTRVNAQWQSIKASQIGPNFNAGNYAGAAVGGLNGISTALGGSPVAPTPVPPTTLNPPPTQYNPPPQPYTPPAPSPTPPTVSTPTNSSGGSNTGLIIFGVLVLLGGGGAAWYFISQSKANKKAKQQDAKNKATSCATEIEAFDAAKLTVLDAKISAAAKGCSAADSTSLSTLMTTLKTGASEALQQYGRLQQSSNPDDDGKSAEEYQSMSSAYDALLTDLSAAKATQTSIDTKLGQIKTAGEQAKPALAQLGKDLETATADIVAAQEAGFKIESLETDLTEAVTDQASAETELEGGRAAAAKSLCDTGSAKAKQVSKDAKALAQRAKEITKRIVTLKASIVSSNASLETAKSDVASMNQAYAPNSLETVAGNGGRAATCIQMATQCCTDAAASSTMEQQDWSGAEKSLDTAEAQIREADSQLRSVTALKQSLETARANAPTTLTQARQEVSEAQAYIKTNAADIEDGLEGDLLQKLRDAAATLPSQAALSAPRPDYLAIIASAQAASKVAGTVLKGARSDKENTIRQRKLAATATETAVASISTATEYCQDHSETVGSRYDETIRSAKTVLDVSRSQVNNPAEQLRLAEQAAQTAADALSGAKELVRAARARAQLQQQQSSGGGYGTQRSTSNNDDAFMAGAVVGVLASTLANSDNNNGGGLMSGGDDIPSAPTPDFGGGGLMSGNDDIPSGGNPSSDDL